MGKKYKFVAPQMRFTLLKKKKKKKRFMMILVKREIRGIENRENKLVFGVVW